MKHIRIFLSVFIAMSMLTVLSACDNRKASSESSINSNEMVDDLIEKNSELEEKNSELNEENMNLKAEKVQQELMDIVQDYNFENPQESITLILETGMKELVDDKILVTFDEQTNTYTVYTWKENLANYIEAEQENASELLNGLTNTLNDWLSYLTGLIHTLDDTVNINMVIVNDLDPEEYFIIIKNGEIIYNILEQ